VDQNRWIPQAGSSDHANAVIERNQWVQDTLNCTIEYIPYNEAEMKAAVLAGDKYADIVISQMWSIARHGQARELADMSQMTQIDFDANYWKDFNVVNYLQFDTQIVGLSSSFASQTDQIWATFFNKRLISELNLENPYDLVESGQWTFDKFLAMQQAAKLDVDGNGVFDQNDRYGFAVGHDWDASVVMFLASGNPMTRTNADGSMSFNIDNEKSFATIDMVKRMLAKGDTFFPKESDTDMSMYIQAFTEGKSLFLAYSFGDATMSPVYQMNDDFGIVPMPKGPDADNYKCWVSHNAPTIGVPASNRDMDKTGYVLEALAYRAYPEEANFFDEISLTRLRDDESLDTLLRLKEWGVSDYLFMGQQGAGGCNAGLNLVVNTCYINQDTMEPVSEAAAIEEQVNLALIESVQKFTGTYVEPEPVEEPAAEEPAAEEPAAEEPAEEAAGA
jgi:hypothetical protein